MTYCEQINKAIREGSLRVTNLESDSDSDGSTRIWNKNYSENDYDEGKDNVMDSNEFDATVPAKTGVILKCRFPSLPMRYECLGNNEGIVHWPGSPPVQATLRSCVMVFVGVAMEVNDKAVTAPITYKALQLFDGAHPVIALHISTMRSLQTYVDTIKKLIETAGFGDSESLRVGVFGGGTRVCSKESHMEVVKIFEETKTALSNGRTHWDSFVSLKEKHLEHDAGDAALLGAGGGLVSLAICFELRNELNIDLSFFFHEGFVVRYDELLLSMNPCCLPPIQALPDNTNIGRQVIVLRAGQVCQYMAGTAMSPPVASRSSKKRQEEIGIAENAELLYAYNTGDGSRFMSKGCNILNMYEKNEEDTNERVGSIMKGIVIKYGLKAGSRDNQVHGRGTLHDFWHKVSFS